MTSEPDILGYVTAKATEASKMLDTRKLIIIHVHVFAAKNTKLIMQTSPCNEYPLTPHIYIVKLGFTECTLFSYFCSKILIVGTR